MALPFGDSRKAFLSRKFKVFGIPMLVAIGSSGRTVTKEARDLVMIHGADAYPFPVRIAKGTSDFPFESPEFACAPASIKTATKSAFPRLRKSTSP